MNQSKKLRVAAIMDEFTYCSFAPECELIQLTPENFKAEIDEFSPDMLFIESAWRGKDALWRYKLYDNMEELIKLTDYCRKLGIPIVFWSKEDPVHFGLFCQTAALADYVFTTDAECIGMYKCILGHNRVYYLPFAAQPKTHNPIEEYERQDKFCFAGSFYTKYKERSKTFLDLADLFMEKGLDIYDRNFNKADPANSSETEFPPELQKCILGGLPYSEITRAYKGYKYGINTTSMVQSGFMFARRVFELLACNTVVVSNFSRGLELFFGDLIIETNDREYMRKQLEKYCGTETDYRKYRLSGLRHVLKSHLYEDRLDRISQIVLDRSIKNPLPKILVVCEKATEKIKKMFDSQNYTNKQLVVADSAIKLSELNFDYVTVFSDRDYYGKNYLTDFALATRFAHDDIIGKAAYYSDGKVISKEKAYTRVTENINLSRQMASKSIFDDSVYTSDLFDYTKCAVILSLDEFNYCRNADSCSEADDIEVYAGMDLDQIYERTDRISPSVLKKSKEFLVEELYNEILIKESDKVTKSIENGNLKLVRNADDDTVVWLYTDKKYQLSDYVENNRIGFYPESSEKRGNVRCQIEYYDENNVKLGYMNFVLDGFTLLYINENAKSFRLIFRMRGKAAVTLKSMYSAAPQQVLTLPFPIKKQLLLTENYPDYDRKDVSNELHVFAKEHDLEVLKVSANPGYLSYSEYEGVNIVSSQYSAIKEYINAYDFECIYITANSPKIEEYLSDYKGRIVRI